MNVLVQFTFPFGSLVRLTAEFRDPLNADELVDPTTVTVKVKKPDATIVSKVYGTDIEVIRDAVGQYHMDVECDAAGPWVQGWFGVGAFQAANEHGFKVLTTAF